MTAISRHVATYIAIPQKINIWSTAFRPAVVNLYKIRKLKNPKPACMIKDSDLTLMRPIEQLYARQKHF